MADMWFPSLKKEWQTLFLFIMCTPPANQRIYVKSSTLYIGYYGNSTGKKGGGNA